MHCTKSKVVLLHGIVYHMTYIYNYSGNWTIDGCKMVPCHWHNYPTVFCYGIYENGI